MGGLGVSRRAGMMQELQTEELFENWVPGLLSLLHVARELPFPTPAEDELYFQKPSVGHS